MSKSFGSVQAVVGVSLVLYPGEILGVVGDNAAGKSTLMKLLTGVHKPDGGKVLVEGRPVVISGPHVARKQGIEMIYQDFSLAPNLSIADNIFLGREPTRRYWMFSMLDRAKMERISKQVLDQTLMRFDSVRTTVTDLSGGQQQAVAIARALAFNAKVIVMDEPTASLSVKSIAPLLSLMKRFRDEGISMIFITHRIQDIFDTCDRVMVMRRGACVGTSEIADTNLEEVTGLITGTREAFGIAPDRMEH